MMLRAGRLRHYIAIEQCSTTRDGDGDPVPSWQVFATDVPAEIAPLSGRELIAAGATQSDVSVRIMIRYLAGLDASMRVRRLDDDRLYNISAIIEDPESGREWMTLLVRTGAGVDRT